jgi:hypothetical protein
MHSSVRLNTPIEFINVTPVNPLISKCQIKVCWVGEEPNRNRTIITKDTAKEMAKSLPGSPIVGYYNEETKDFEGHNREFSIENGQITFKDTTRPYGFVDLNAKIWFAKYLDDGQVEREYLMTEGWLWTGQYPECERVFTIGNNQSMELDEKSAKMSRTKGDNQTPCFFIINEAIMSKLCILGEDVEPCFEGANIATPTVRFTFSQGFEETMYSMMTELKDLLNKGGTDTMNEEVKVPAIEEETPVVENPEVVEEPVVDEVAPAAEPVAEEPVVEEEPAATEFEAEQETCPECGKPVEECQCKGAEKYILEEIPEYVDLLARYQALEQERNTLQEQLQPLVEFKAKIEKKEKEAMIAKFSMLSEQDKKDVVDNIDTYSLDEIEAKLSVICVRNKVSFADLDDDKNEATVKEEPVTYSLAGEDNADLSVPAWVKAALKMQENMN